MPADETLVPTQATPKLLEFGRQRLASGAYYFDLDAVAAFPLTENGQPSTFAEIYHKVRDAKILRVPDRARGDVNFETEAGIVTISGEAARPYISGQIFVINLLENLIELHSAGIDPYRTTWFYYGHDWSRDADELFFFFLIQDGRIVRETVSFLHCSPRVLIKSKVDGEPTWHAERYQNQAWESYWYRKFYTETQTGQLMVLRPDEPILYHYNRVIHDATRDVQFITLIKAYRLLWIAVALLTAIAIPLLRSYMVIVAAFLFADLLYRIWVTRKIGR